MFNYGVCGLAEFVDVILYSKEQITKENEGLNYFFD